MRCCAVVVAVVSMSVAAGIALKQEMPKPGPEHQRLGAFVGNWTFEGELKPGPIGPGGKMTGTDRIDWAPGNFFVQRSYQGTSPNGEMQGLEILAYDGAKKIYTFNAFDSLRMMASGTMTVKGNTWTTTGTMTMGATTMRPLLAGVRGRRLDADDHVRDLDGRQDVDPDVRRKGEEDQPVTSGGQIATMTAELRRRGWARRHVVVVF